jgi:hypothetical protein
VKKIFLFIFLVLALYSCNLGKKLGSTKPNFNAPIGDSVHVVDSTVRVMNNSLEFTPDKITVGSSAGDVPELHYTQLCPTPAVAYKKQKGLITYSIPDTIKWGEFATVELRITKGKYTTDFVLKGNNVVIDSIRVASTMKVELIDIENAFEKIDLASAIQAVEDGDEYTSWKWSIKPVIPGTHRLDIVIQIITDGVPKNIPVATYKVFVQSQPLVEKITDGIKSEIDWTKIVSVIITAGIFPLIIFLWKRRKKKKQKPSK